MWSFPYYLVGVAVVGLLPLGGQSLSPTAWVVVLPVLYLVHFYHGLSVELAPPEAPKSTVVSELRLPKPAKIYVGLIIAAGTGLLGWGLFHWESGKRGAIPGLPRAHNADLGLEGLAAQDDGDDLGQFRGAAGGDGPS